MMSIVLTAVLLVFVISISLVLFFVRKGSTTSRSNPSLSMLPDDMSAPFPSQLNTPAPYSPLSSNPTRPTSPQPTYDPSYSSFSNRGTNPATRSTSYNGSFSTQNYAQSYPTASASTHPQHEFAQTAPTKSPQYEFAPPPPAKSPQKNLSFYELELQYERGMQATYDDYLDATHLIITNVVMKTPTEVDIAFRVCTRKIQAVLRSRGKERAAILVDIAGLVIGGEATTVWGQNLKVCWDKICSVTGKDQYLAAHYNSKASQPSREQLQEKIRRIQIMTSAVLNDFQSNIFDTREEAVAFLQRMRELKAS